MASFVEFPIFRKLTIADKKNYENIYRMFEPYADLSFSNLIVWFSIVEDVEISEHPNGNIILRYRNPLDYNTPCYTFLGNGNCSETINSIINLQDQLNVDAGLSMVPSAVARELILSKEINDYTFIAEESNRNYIFKTSDISSLTGGRFENLRYKVRYFDKNTKGDIEFKEIALDIENNRNDILYCLEEWLDPRLITKPHIRSSIENDVIKRQLQFRQELDTKALGLYINGNLQGFCIYHYLPQDNYIIGNHIKCNYHFRYIFDYIYHSLANVLLADGIEFINAEQDLGIESIRRHKMEMRPDHFLDVYTIKPKG